MAKKKKIPKRPKITASKSTWDAWAKRAAEVQKYNNSIDSDKAYKKKLASKFR